MSTFDQIVEVPEDAPLNEGGAPSDEQYRAARVDAWTFLNGDFAEFSKGEIGMLDLAGNMVALAQKVERDEVDDEGESGLSSFMRVGENDPLALLLYWGAERPSRQGKLAAEAAKAATSAEKMLERRKEETL